jgi:hypothetical protein
MRHATTHSTQVVTPFGSGYVPEQRADETRWNLGPSDVDGVVASLRVSMFSELMKSLRSSLSLR